MKELVFSLAVGILTHEQGFREEPYLCSEGYVTIGYGTKLHCDQCQDPSRFTIRVTEMIAMSLLHHELQRVVPQLEKIDGWELLSPQRKAVIVSMAYQMGVSGVKGFRNMWEAIRNEDYHTAASEMMDSRWARQTPERAGRHAVIMETNNLGTLYARS